MFDPSKYTLGRLVLVTSCWLVTGVVALTANAQNPPLSTVPGEVPTSTEKIDFGSQVKPILSDNCYACHGPDEGQRSTGFRLDQKQSALDPDFSVIVPGDSENSLLVQRILSDDPDEVMPPADHRKHLTPGQRQTLVQWIEQGADWSEHWAFQRPLPSPNPVVVDATWPINYVDYYVLKRLEQKKIQPSKPAPDHTLLRRLTFDLTGLPPTTEELDQFLRDSQTDGKQVAYEHAVDRLLASPHFGERLAVYWLDLVRYADTVGYHGDQDVSVSPYRDYVIDAFNQSMPFDQFTREQLAGDLLENPTQQQLIASGYNRLGMMSAEGGVQPEEYLNKYASDRVRTTATAWLGITLGCAECHDHKFDPFSAKEFYQFAAYFSDIKEKGLYSSSAHASGKWGPSMDVADPELPRLLAPIDSEIARLNAAIIPTDATRVEQTTWETKHSVTDFKWQTLHPIKLDSIHPLRTEIADDHSILVGGENPDTECYVISTQVEPAAKAFRLESLPHAELPNQGAGRAGNGNFVVTELIVLRGRYDDRIAELQKPFAQWTADLRENVIQLKNATASIEQVASAGSHPDNKWSAGSVIDGDARGEKWGWAVLPDVKQANQWVAQVADDQVLGKDVTFVIQQFHGNHSHTLGHFRLAQSALGDATALSRNKFPEHVSAILKVPSADRSDEQQQELAKYYLTIAAEYQGIRDQLAALEKQRQSIVDQHTRSTLITVSVEPRTTRVLTRGDWMDKSGTVVEPNVPKILGGNELLASDSITRRTRLDLANWVVSEQNPLTARVFVNRIWRMYFGNGISNVLDDLGSQGEPPSHPQLLDRMAVEFMTSGWDVKQMVRTIVMSNTYRQSSVLRTDLLETDPENRLLARQARFRLDAEFIRDNALEVSGLLVKDVGGESVKPYQPVGLLRHLNFPQRTYQPSQGAGQHRRGVYTHWQRQFLHPAMKTFDAPPREECTAARPRSSTPLAALVLLNDPSYVEAANALAKRAIQAETDTPARIGWIFRRAFSRSANESELALIETFLESQLSHFRLHPEEAEQLTAIGDQNASDQNAGDPTPQPAAVEQAAWSCVCRAVMNMHEFIVRN